MAIKNNALTVQYLAWDTSANTPKTGDVANHTLRVIKDGTAAAPTNTPAEVDATNAPGIYKLVLTSTEMNANFIALAGKSSTSNIVIMPVMINTEVGFLRAIARKDGSLENALGGTYDNTLMSIEAQYASDAAAFITMIPVVPFSIDLANTATVRCALALMDSISDLPTTAEITPGTVTIERKARNAASWTTIRSAVANSEAAGLVYYDEVFSSANGYAEGDSVRFTFKNVSVLVDTTTIVVVGSTGITFQTVIRESASGGSGLTAQQTRDSLMLAPTAGTPAVGSIDKQIDDIQTKTDAIPGSPAAVGSAMTLAAGAIAEATFNADTAKYQMKVTIIDDDAGSSDLYMVTFFKNGQPVVTGITSPTIQVIKALDGSDLVAQTALTQVSTTGYYKKAETTNRIVAGAGYIVKVTASLDSATRTWSQPIGRDSQA